MIRERAARLLLLVLVSLAPAVVSAQEEGISRRKQEKLQVKKEREEKKEQQRAEKEGRKRHQGIQDKATRKRIKRNTRRADRHGTNSHRDPWPRRWFTR
jgi:Flp pilus assembly protein TadB